MPDTSRSALLHAVTVAIGDPGSVTPRQLSGSGCRYESDPDWRARAVLEAVRPFLAKPASGRDVIHDPETDWCSCEPLSARRCNYRMLADAVAEAFNPPDGDEAEVAILISAVEQARDVLAAIPCSCTLTMVADGDQCARCGALGQRDGKPVQR